MILERIRVGVHPYTRITRQETGTTPTLTERAVEFKEHSRERSPKQDTLPREREETRDEPEAEVHSQANQEAEQARPHVDVRA